MKWTFFTNRRTCLFFYCVTAVLLRNTEFFLVPTVCTFEKQLTGEGLVRNLALYYALYYIFHLAIPVLMCCFSKFHCPLGSVHADYSKDRGVGHSLLEKETEPHLLEGVGHSLLEKETEPHLLEGVGHSLLEKETEPHL